MKKLIAILLVLLVASAFVLPSLYEGLPITLIEAQAVGAKCFVSDKVTSEVQLGLIEYLPLDKETWIEKIVAQSKQERAHTPTRSVLFDDKFQTAIFDGIYFNVDAEEWIIRGKEYSIGSKRFLRSKELSFACFKKAHEIGNVRGSFYYALCYFEGNGVKKDKEKAREKDKRAQEEANKKHEQDLAHEKERLVESDRARFVDDNRAYRRPYNH